MPRINHFIFAADTHLKKCAWASRPDIQYDTFVSFKQCVDLAVKLHLPLVLGGDNFDNPRPTSEVLKFAIEQAERLDNNRFGASLLAIDGNHDKSDPSWISLLPGAINLDGQHIELGSSLHISGLSYKPVTELKQALTDIQKQKSDVLICHQLVDLLCPADIWNMQADWITKPRMVLLGDYHATVQKKSTNGTIFAYPGSTALQSLGESGEKFVYVVSTDSDFNDLKLEKIPLITRKYFKFNVLCHDDLITISDSIRAGVYPGLYSEYPDTTLAAKEFEQIRTPIVRIKYDPSIVGITDLLKGLIKEPCHLWTIPFQMAQNEANQKPGALVLNLDELLAQYLDVTKDPEATELTKQLITDEFSTNEILTKWRTAYKL